MPDLKPYSGDTKLVVAFDIGTTFSGISYCILERGLVPEVLQVARFPALPPVGGDARVPSLLYYDKTGHVRAAGAEVLTESVIEAALTEGWSKAEWWKLHLRPKHLVSSIVRDDDLPPLPSGKSAVDVLTDFIKYLFQCVKDYIQKHHPALTWSTIGHSIEYIFTHPNGWEGEQQQLYRQAIELAGLIPSTPEGYSRVHMLTEGEASLHFCIPNLLSVETVDQTTPQGVAIIDAGGGTIDLSMFSMSFGPISCEEIAPAECRLQGSVFVTRRARVLLQRRLEGWERSTPNEIDEYTREFDHSTKLVIKSDQEPAYVKVAGRRYKNSKYNISLGRLKLTGEEATGLFNESIDAIIGAFEQQQGFAKIPISTAFLVGGLSANDWIWSRLQSYFKDKDINICRPDNHINKAVASGAVLSHVDRENHLVPSRVARATYGVVCSVPVKKNDAEHIRRKHQWERDPDGNCYVPGYFQSKVRRGAHIPEEMEFRESFTLTERNLADFGMQIVRLTCYQGSLSDPKWVDEDRSSFSTYCTIRADLSKAAKDLVLPKGASSQAHYQLDYDVIILFGLPELQAYLGWETKDGERRIPAIISFEESPRGLGQLENSEHNVRSAPSLDNDQDAEQSDLPEGYHDDNHPVPASSHDKLASTVTAAIATVTKTITISTTRIEQWRDEVVRNKGQITISRTDLDRLLLDLSSSSSQMTKLQQNSIELSKSLCDERDRTITSLTAEDAAKAQQITALRRDNEMVLRDFATASSQIKELQQRYHVQLEELASANKELKARAMVIEERDCTIATLTAEVAQAKQLDVEKTTQIPVGMFQSDPSAPSHTAELQKRQQRYEVQPYVQYGVVCALPVDADDEEHVRRKDQWETDPTGDCYVPGYFESKVRMGAGTCEEREFRDPFSLIRSNPADFAMQTVRILCYRGSLSDPKWVDEDEPSFSILCTVYVDLSEAVKDLVMKKDDSGEVYYQLDYDVIVTFGRTDLHAELCWISRTGERRISATVSYED